jgi:hypothetical protein
MKIEIILYQADGSPESIEVRIVEETVWLDLQHISLIFGRDLNIPRASTLGSEMMIQ